MNRTPTIPDPDPLVDRETLRMLAQYLSDSPVIDQATLYPDPYEPRDIRAELNENSISLPFDSHQLVVRWFIDNNFQIRLSSTESDTDWQCQWHRHPSSDQWTHFHCPPAGERVEHLSLESTHPIDVVSTVLSAIKQYRLKED